MILKKYKLVFIIINILFIISIACASYFYFEVTRFLNNPFNPSSSEEIFTIKPGQSLTAIARNLEKEKLITNQTYFKLFVRYKKSGKNLQAGEYLLSGSKSPIQILDILLKGKVKLYRITVPEGLNIKETALLVEKASFCNKEDFIELCENRSFIISLDIKSTSLEGYLYPDTYFFPKNASCKTIISTMINHFNQVFHSEWKSRAEKLNYSVHEMITLASIIEKETGDASERPLISSVFHNRLKRNMRLESDPTVIYGIKNFDGNIKRKHLKMLTPYNTYQIKGLPMGPIANPGAKAIEAALYPVQSDYLFFVSKKDTTHKFSKTVQEHNKAVRKYQLRRK